MIKLKWCQFTCLHSLEHYLNQLLLFNLSIERINKIEEITPTTTRENK